MAESSEGPRQKPPSRRTGAWAWSLALVFVTLIVVGGLLVHQAMNAPKDLVDASGRIVGKTFDETREIVGRVYEKIRDGLRPNVRYTTLITNQFSELSARPKLVVLTATTTVEVVKRSEKSALWGLLDLGDTVVRLKADGNRVQFYVPVGEIRPEDFSYDAVRKQVVVRVPAPVLDRDIVEVQSDPAKIQVQTKVGWARLQSYSGKHLEAKAREALRQEVLASADSRPMRDMARMQAEKSLRGLFRDLADSLQPGVTLVFEFKEEPGVSPADKKPAAGKP
jgi:hypothetical protein